LAAAPSDEADEVLEGRPAILRKAGSDFDAELRVVGLPLAAGGRQGFGQRLRLTVAVPSAKTVHNRPPISLGLSLPSALNQKIDQFSRLNRVSAAALRRAG
jgi:hypothetical protein